MQEVKSGFEGQQNKKSWITNRLFPVHLPCASSRIVQYSVLSMMFKYMGMLPAPLQSQSHFIFNKHPYTAPAFLTESSSVC